MVSKEVVVIYFDQPEQLLWRQYSSMGEKRVEQRYQLDDQLPVITANNAVIVLLPGHQIVTTRVKMPKTNRSALLKALPFVLEEQLATDITALSFVAEQRDEKGWVPVAIIDKEVLQCTIDWLQQQKIHADLIVPDYFMVPCKADAWNIDIQEDKVWVRASRELGFTADRTNLITIVQAYLSSSAQTMPDTVLVNNREMADKLHQLIDETRSITIKLSDDHANDYLQLLRDCPLNLSANNYRSKKSANTHYSRWRWPGIMGIIFVLIVFASPIAQWFVYRSQANKINVEINQLYYRVFPEASDVAEPEFRLKHELGLLSSASRGDQFLRLLTEVSVVLKQYPQIKLNEIKYQDNRLVMRISGNKLADLDRVYRSLRNKQLQVKQTLSNSDTQSFHAELIITERTR